MATQNSIDSQNPIQVALGGTGAITLTNHGVLVGAATSAITQLSVGATGTVLIGTTSSDPSFSATPTVTSITLGTGSALSNYVTTTSWTPALNFGGASTGITYSSQTGSYMRIGSLVYFTCNVQLSNKGSSAGAATINGLPISVAVDAAVSWRGGAIAFTGTILCRVAGTSIFIDGITTAGTLSQIQNTAFSNSSQIIVTGSYLV